MVPALTEETYNKKWKHYPECKYECDHKQKMKKRISFTDILLITS